MGQETDALAPPPTYQQATQVGDQGGQPPTVPPPMFVQQQYPPPQQAYPHPPQMQPQTVIIQPNPATVAYVQQPHNAQRVIVIHEPKVAPSFDPYQEFCPYCNQIVVTRRRYVMGSMTCLFIFLSLIFLPFICCICCNTFQDAHHYCPHCNRLIAIRTR